MFRAGEDVSGRDIVAFSLSQDELDLQARARELARAVIAKRASDIDQSREYPWDIVEAMKDARLLGMTLPKEHGGQGRSFLDAVLVIEAIAGACTVAARIAVETNMGAVSAVMATAPRSRRG